MEKAEKVLDVTMGDGMALIVDASVYKGDWEEDPGAIELLTESEVKNILLEWYVANRLS